MFLKIIVFLLLIAILASWAATIRPACRNIILFCPIHDTGKMRKTVPNVYQLCTIYNDDYNKKRQGLLWTVENPNYHYENQNNTFLKSALSTSCL